jgi:hypothetical protein
VLAFFVYLVLLRRFHRAVVEHTFAQLKRFEILGGKFRGRLGTERGVQRLGDALTVISGIIALQVERSPLRNEEEPLLPAGDMAALDAAAAAGAAADLLVPRPMRHGFPLGDTDLDLIREGGELRGRGPQPSDAAVDSGNAFADFQPRARVWVWWWGSLWRATVVRLQLRAQTLVVRFDASGQSASDYPPRLLWPL